MKFQLNPAVQLHWHCCESDHLVFDETSGQTHQLDPVRAFVLTELQVAPQRFDDLVRELASAFESEAPEVLDGLLSNVLDEFKSFGLVEAVAE